MTHGSGYIVGADVSSEALAVGSYATVSVRSKLPATARSQLPVDRRIRNEQIQPTSTAIAVRKRSHIKIVHFGGITDENHTARGRQGWFSWTTRNCSRTRYGLPQGALPTMTTSINGPCPKRYPLRVGILTPRILGSARTSTMRSDGSRLGILSTAATTDVPSPFRVRDCPDRHHDDRPANDQ